MFNGVFRQTVQKPTPTKHEYNSARYNIDMGDTCISYHIDFLTGKSITSFLTEDGNIISQNYG